MKETLLLLCFFTLMLSCKNEEPSPPIPSNIKANKVETMNTNPQPLKTALDAMKEASANKGDAAKKAAYAEGIRTVENSGLLESAKQE